MRATASEPPPSPRSARRSANSRSSAPPTSSPGVPHPRRPLGGSCERSPDRNRTPFAGRFTRQRASLKSGTPRPRSPSDATPSCSSRSASRGAPHPGPSRCPPDPRPWPRRAASSPATVRSRISSRSSPAGAAKMPNTRRPAAVVVSACVPSPTSTPRPTPRADRSCAVSTRWRRFRSRRSSFQTTLTPPFRRERRQLSSPGRPRRRRPPPGRRAGGPASGEGGDPDAEPCAGVRSRDRLSVGPAGLVGIGNHDQPPHAGRLQLPGVPGPPLAGPARVARRRQVQRP